MTGEYDISFETIIEQHYGKWMEQTGARKIYETIYPFALSTERKLFVTTSKKNYYNSSNRKNPSVKSISYIGNHTELSQTRYRQMSQ